MQCASCQFENMPGSAVCGRCGTSLGLATAVIDVHPPRAGRWVKRVRRLTPRIPVRGRTAEALKTAVVRSKGVLGVRLNDSTPAVPLLLRMPVPGWPQIYAGNRVLGRIFLYPWVFLLLVWVMFFYGTTVGSVLLGMAFSFHSSSVADAANRVLEPMSIRRRVVYAVGIAALLLGLFYVPAGRVLFRYADPIVMQMDVRPFREGDVVLVNHAAFSGTGPRAGQLVLFTPPEYQVGGYPNPTTIYRGPRIDRILAGPGDQVVWAKGRLTVNGRMTELEPLNRSVMPERFVLRVPGDRYLIVPTGTPELRKNTDLLGMSMIAREEIEGLVYLQTQPLSRMRVLR